MDIDAQCRIESVITPESIGRTVIMLKHQLIPNAHRRSPKRRVIDTSAGTLEWGRTYLSNYFAKPTSAMHEWLGRQLDAMRSERGLKVNLIGPRGSAKSTIASLCYVLRAAVEGWDPYIWIVSDTKPQAQMHLESVKSELLGNVQLARDYPESCGRGAIWRGNFIELGNGVVVEAIGTMQRSRGRRNKEHRPTLIVCDDLQNDGHISSTVQREASRLWFHGSLLKAGSTTTNVINVGTALHREALAMELQATAGWISACFAAIQAWPTNTSLWDEWESLYCDVDKPDARHAARLFYETNKEAMDAGAVVLWPEVEDLYALMQMRVESGRTAFEREKQGSPVDPDLCEWPESYFDDRIWFDTWPSDLVIRAIALDPSKGGDAQRGDYSAYVIVGIDAHGVVYVEADLGRRPTPQIVADGAALCRRFRPTVFGVEANQFQELLCDELAAEFVRQGVGYVVLAAIHNYAKKPVRIRRLGPYLSQRRLRF